MQTVRPLKKKDLQNVEIVKDFVAGLGTLKLKGGDIGKKDSKAPGEKKVKTAARDVLDSLMKAGASRKPSSIDTAIANAMAKKKGVVQELAALAEKGSTSPVEYYEVYYKVLADSGLIGATVPSPDIIRKLESMREEMKQGETVKGCGACLACSACIVCAACYFPVAVKATAGAGVAGATAALLV